MLPTERDFLTCKQPQAMLRLLAEQVSVRKLRLFTCACCRAVWSQLADPRSCQAVVATEAWADGLLSEAARLAAVEAARRAEGQLRGQVWRSGAATGLATAAHLTIRGSGVTSTDVAGCARDVAILTATAIGEQQQPADDFLNRARGEKLQAALLADILGNPFQPPHFDPRWRTSSVVALADAIYDDRDFDLLPILADALEDADCDHLELLSHCRSRTKHVRGCWAVDLVLGKHQ